jgi:hypothetical protein
VDEGELHREAEPVVLSTVLPRQVQVFRRQRVTTLGLIVIRRRVEQRGAQLR